MKKFFFCIVCGIVIYESFSGDFHNHLPEQHYQTAPIQKFSPIVGTATISLNWQPLYQIGSDPYTSNIALMSPR